MAKADGVEMDGFIERLTQEMEIAGRDEWLKHMGRNGWNQEC